MHDRSFQKACDKNDVRFVRFVFCVDEGVKKSRGFVKVVILKERLQTRRVIAGEQCSFEPRVRSSSYVS